MNYELEGSVTIKEIVDHFEYEIVCGNEDSLLRWVIVPDINRPGLELTGFYEHTEPRRIVIIGDKEESYIKTLDYDTQVDRFSNILDGFTPAVILTKGRECPMALIDVASKRNFPVLSTKAPTYRVMTDMITYLDSKLAPVDNLHGVFLNVYGVGVLIVGDSGMGKSETALDLIKRGHILIADDRVDVSRVHNKIKGRAPELLKGMLEIRGIGVIDVAKMFGVTSILEVNNVDLVIKLEPFDNCNAYNRVGNEEEHCLNIMDIRVPMTIIPVSNGRNIGVLVETAVTNFRLKASGFNSAKEFEQRVLDYIEKQNVINRQEVNK